MTIISDVDQYKKFIKNNKRVVIFYSSENCPACTDIKDLYGRIGFRYKKYIALAYVDVDKCDLNYKVLPLFVGVLNDKPLLAMEGANSENLKSFIKEIIKS